MTERTSTILSTIFLFTTIIVGFFTFFAYIGAPIHQVLFSNETTIRSLDTVCGTKMTAAMFLCRAPSAVLPFIVGFFQTMSPFFPYIIASFLGLSAYLFFVGYNTGSFSIEKKVRPASLVLAFLASVWLIGTTLSFFTLHNLRLGEQYKVTDLNNQPILPPFNRFYEPKQELYPNVGVDGMKALQENFNTLLARGCLSPLTKDGQELATRSGSRIFTYSPLCAQYALFTRVLPQFLLVTLFLCNLLILGRWMLDAWLKLTEISSLARIGLSFGLGSLLLTAILWTLGIFSLLIQSIVIPLFFGIPLLLFPWTKKWLQEAYQTKIDYTFSFTSVHMWLTWLLISYLALNFLNVIRPFPIGWDDLGSYLNTPRLLASYGHFISNLSRFQWEYLTSLGFTLFGYDSFVGSTFAMQVNWAAGLLATLSVYIMTRSFFGVGSGLLATILYTFLPVVGHFSFADMKIDNATFFTSALGIFAVFLAIEESSKKKKYLLLGIAGIVLSFSFAIKATAILAFLLAFTVLTIARCGKAGGILAGFLSFLILAIYGPLSLQNILTLSGVNITVPTLLLPAILLVGITLTMVYLFQRERRIVTQEWFQESALLGIGFCSVIVLWGSHNAWLNGQITFSSVLGAPDRLTPEISYRERKDIDPLTLASGRTIRSLPSELKLDPNHPACIGNARSEELDRYWGFSKNLSHFVLLPWRQMMNIDAIGYYVTLYPALFLFPLLLLVPAFWSKERRWLRLLFVGTFLLMIQWMFVGNGVIWYGITMFLGLSIGLEALLRDSPTQESKWIVRTLLTLSVMVCLLNRFWQFDVQRNVMEYPLGKTSAEVLQETTIMHYDNIRTTVLERAESTPETPYAFRIGTFIPYFIPRNREFLPLADNQLTFFNCINQEKDHTLTLKRLKALGFNSIIFDTNAATIESDPKGSLHQKVQSFIDFANDQSIALETPIYDPDDGLAFILLP